MKITPLEIRQKEFNKNFRGYDKDEVSAFLQSLSSEWEKLQTEYQGTLKKLEESEKEVQKLKEVENSLFKTLKTAEDTGANMVEQSKQAAELHLKEAKMQVESMLNDANNKARNIIEEAEDIAASTFQNLVDELKDVEDSFKSIEKLREDFMQDMKNSAHDILDRLKKMESKMESTGDLSLKIKETKKEFKGKKAVKDLMEEDTLPALKEEKPKESNTVDKKEEVSEKKHSAEGSSFFDEID